MVNCTRTHLLKSLKLRLVCEIADKILGKNKVRTLGFNISVSKITAWEAVMQNRVEEEPPSASDMAKADEIELQEIVESLEDFISQMKHDQLQTDNFEYPLGKLLGLDKQLRSIRGLLKIDVAEKVQLEENIKKEKHKPEEIREYPGEYDDGI